MVENMKKLAWGVRGRRFKSSHPDSFMSYEQDPRLHNSLFLPRWWIGGGQFPNESSLSLQRVAHVDCTDNRFSHRSKRDPLEE